jgi:Casein kinase substrate phosphoprotein PP28
MSFTSREALEAAAAKERFWKLQEAGKTDQARADLARLAIIKKEREEKAKQRQVTSK